MPARSFCENVRSRLFLDQHPCNAQLSGVVIQQGVRDGTQVVLTQDREEVAADIQLRQAANDRSVLHQISATSSANFSAKICVTVSSGLAVASGQE